MDQNEKCVTVIICPKNEKTNKYIRNLLIQEKENQKGKTIYMENRYSNFYKEIGFPIEQTDIVKIWEEERKHLKFSDPMINYELERKRRTPLSIVLVNRSALDFMFTHRFNLSRYNVQIYFIFDNSTDLDHVLIRFSWYVTELVLFRESIPMKILDRLKSYFWYPYDLNPNKFIFEEFCQECLNYQSYSSDQILPEINLHLLKDISKIIYHYYDSKWMHFLF